MHKDLVSIIIVNWNGLQHLEKCLPSVYQTTHPDYEVILVDNGSTDDSTKFIRTNFPQTKIVQNNENLGFAEANNIGFENSCGEYIFLLNNDTTIEPDLIAKLVAEQKKDFSVGGIQPKILRMSEPNKLDCVGDYPTLTGIFEHYGLGEDAANPEFQKNIEIFAMKGAAMFLRQQVIEEVGLFDPDFFAYYEETDFCHRILLAGYKIIYSPTSAVYHRGYGTSENFSFNFIQEHAFKNRICSFIKNLGVRELLKILPLHLLLCQGLAVFYTIKRRDIKFFIMIQKSFWWNIQNFSQTLRKRKQVQSKIRKVTDASFFPKLKRSIGLKNAISRLLTSFSFKNKLLD